MKMADVHTPKQRRYNMSQVRGRDTKPELKLKDPLKRKGFVYQPKEFGKPDFIHYGKKKVVFIDGCFWHKCSKCFKLPKTNKEFWKKKIDDNVKRDTEVSLNYQNSGWEVIRLWEHSLRNLDPENLINSRYL